MSSHHSLEDGNSDGSGGSLFGDLPDNGSPSARPQKFCPKCYKQTPSAYSSTAIVCEICGEPRMSTAIASCESSEEGEGVHLEINEFPSVPFCFHCNRSEEPSNIDGEVCGNCGRSVLYISVAKTRRARDTSDSEDKELWVNFEGILYSVREYGDSHPGGADIIKRFAGWDISEIFKAIGHSESAQSVLKGLPLFKPKNPAVTMKSIQQHIIWGTPGLDYHKMIAKDLFLLGPLFPGPSLPESPILEPSVPRLPSRTFTSSELNELLDQKLEWYLSSFLKKNGVNEKSQKTIDSTVFYEGAAVKDLQITLRELVRHKRQDITLYVLTKSKPSAPASRLSTMAYYGAVVMAGIAFLIVGAKRFK